MSLISNDTGHHVHLGHLYVFLGESPLPTFSLGWLSFCYWVTRVLYILWTLNPHQTCDLQIFSSILWAVFSLAWLCSLIHKVLQFKPQKFIFWQFWRLEVLDQGQMGLSAGEASLPGCQIATFSPCPTGLGSHPMPLLNLNHFCKKAPSPNAITTVARASMNLGEGHYSAHNTPTL